MALAMLDGIDGEPSELERGRRISHFRRRARRQEQLEEDELVHSLRRENFV